MSENTPHRGISEGDEVSVTDRNTGLSIQFDVQKIVVVHHAGETWPGLVLNGGATMISYETTTLTTYWYQISNEGFTRQVQLQRIGMGATFYARLRAVRLELGQDDDVVTQWVKEMMFK